MTRGMTFAGVLAAVARSTARFARARGTGGSCPAITISVAISAGVAVTTGISTTARTAAGLGVGRLGAQRLAIRL